MPDYGPAVQPPLRKRRENGEVVVELLSTGNEWYRVKRFDPDPNS